MKIWQNRGYNAIKITYFVHGTTKDNNAGISSGQAHGELSELGIRQSRELPSQIKGKNFDIVFCSDLKRAVDSAEISFKGIYKIVQDKRLRECDYGDLTQAEEDKVVYEDHIDKPFPNGESLKDVEKRVLEFLKFLERERVRWRTHRNCRPQGSAACNRGSAKQEKLEPGPRRRLAKKKNLAAGMGV